MKAIRQRTGPSDKIGFIYMAVAPAVVTDMTLCLAILSAAHGNGPTSLAECVAQLRGSYIAFGTRCVFTTHGT